MAFEKNMFLTAKKEALPKGEFTLECNIVAGENVGKVLTVSAQASVQNQEVLDGVISFAGQVDVKAVYLTEEGEINTANSTCPFSSKIESDVVSKGQCAFVKVDVIDSSCQVMGGDNIRVNVSLVQSGFVVGNQENDRLVCQDDSVCYQNEEMEIIKFVGCAKDSALFESEINLRGDVKKVLLTESQVVVKGVESGVNYITVSGEVVSRVLYISQNDKFESGWVYDSFKQEVELVGVNRDSLVEGYAFVRQDGVVSEITTEENGGKLTIKTPVDFAVFAYEKESISVIKDLYGLEEQINLTAQSFSMSTLCPMELIEGKIEGSLVLDEDKPRVDKVLFSGANKATITNFYLQEGELFVEGIAQTTVVYLNDETSAFYSVVVDVPFVVSDKICCENEGLLSLSVAICDADVVVKKGRELLFDAKIKVSVSCSHMQVGAVISTAEKGESYPQKDYAMEVIFAKTGKSLWEVAKSARVREEQILAQNPDVVFPLTQDCPLVLFYQRVQ